MNVGWTIVCCLVLGGLLAQIIRVLNVIRMYALRSDVRGSLEHPLNMKIMEYGAARYLTPKVAPETAATLETPKESWLRMKLQVEYDKLASEFDALRKERGGLEATIHEHEEAYRRVDAERDTAWKQLYEARAEIAVMCEINKSMVKDRDAARKDLAVWLETTAQIAANEDAPQMKRDALNSAGWRHCYINGGTLEFGWVKEGFADIPGIWVHRATLEEVKNACHCASTEVFLKSPK